MDAKRTVSEEIFRELLETKLKELNNNQWNRALGMFNKYGPHLSWDVTNVLMHAYDQGVEKIDEVLLELEKFFRQVLCFQTPGIRGLITFADGRCSHEKMFDNVYTKTLNLSQ